MEAYEVGVSLIMTHNVTDAAAVIGRHLTGLHFQTEQLRQNFQRLGTVIGGAFAVQAGVGLLRTMETLIQRTKDLNHEMVSLQKMNVMTSDGLGGPQAGTHGRALAEVRREALAITREMKGITEAQAIGIYGQLYGMMGHENALKMMRPGALYGQVAGNTTGDYHKAYEQDLRKMIRAGDLLGKIMDPKTHQVSIERLTQWLQIGTRTLLATHGAVDAQQWLNTAQQGAPALSGKSEKGLVEQSILMQMMGGHRAGTAEMSLFQQFVGGTMAKRTARELERLGILAPGTVGDGGGADADPFTALALRHGVSGVRGRRSGRGSRSHGAGGDHMAIPEEAWQGGIPDKLKASTVDFIEAMMEKMKAKGLATREDQAMAVFRMYGRSTTQREVHDFLRNLEQIKAETTRILVSAGMEDAKKLQDAHDITQGMQNVSAAWWNLMYAFAGPNQQVVVDLLNVTTDAIRSFGEVVRGLSPDTIKAIAAGFVGLGAAFITAGFLAMMAAIAAGGPLIVGLAALAGVITGLATAVALWKPDDPEKKKRREVAIANLVDPNLKEMDDQVALFHALGERIKAFFRIHREQSRDFKSYIREAIPRWAEGIGQKVDESVDWLIRTTGEMWTRLVERVKKDITDAADAIVEGFKGLLNRLLGLFKSDRPIQGPTGNPHQDLFQFGAFNGGFGDARLWHAALGAENDNLRRDVVRDVTLRDVNRSLERLNTLLERGGFGGGSGGLGGGGGGGLGGFGVQGGGGRFNGLGSLAGGDGWKNFAPGKFPNEAPAAIGAAAKELGIDPKDLATVISYETGGRFSPSIMGGKGGNYMGLIQFGPAERAKYGAHAGQSFGEQMGAVVRYLRDRGLKPGMGISELYKTINGGNPYVSGSKSDGNNTIDGHVRAMLGSQHRATAEHMFGGAVASPVNPNDMPKLGKQAALALAMRHLGEHERRDRSKLAAFFKAQGVHVDPATTAWCAAFVNASLGAAGIPGSGSQIANSFLKWGRGVDASGIEAGDVVVEHRNKGVGMAGGHVGIATGRTRMGRRGLEVESIGGNISDSVKSDWAPASRVQVRRPMTPPPPSERPTQIKTDINIDGRKVASAVTRHQANFANGPSHGPQTFDGTRQFAGVDSSLLRAS